MARITVNARHSFYSHTDNSADLNAQIRDRNEDVLKVLCQLRNQDAEHPAILQEMEEIKAAAQQEREMKMTRWTELLIPNNLRRLLIGVFLQVAQQWTGTNAIVSCFIAVLATISCMIMVNAKKELLRSRHF